MCIHNTCCMMLHHTGVCEKPRRAAWVFITGGCSGHFWHFANASREPSCGWAAGPPKEKG